MSNNTSMTRQYTAPFLRSHRTEAQAATRVQLTRLMPLHESIMNYILTNPTLPMSAVAEHHGVTAAWLSTVFHSDLFQAVYQERRVAIASLDNEAISHRLQRMAEKGLDKLITALDDEETPLNNKESITKMALSAIGRLGHGNAATQQPMVAVQVNTGQQAESQRPVTMSAIQEARLRLLQKAEDQHSAVVQSLGNGTATTSTPITIEATVNEQTVNT